MQNIHLQGIGKANAKPAASLEIGDVCVWNYGSTSTVSSIAESNKTVFVEFTNGTSRRMNKTRLVAVQ